MPKHYGKEENGKKPMKNGNGDKKPMPKKGK